MIQVLVKFRYGNKGSKPNVGSQTSLQVEARTESAVMAALRKRYPDKELIILEIK